MSDFFGKTQFWIRRRYNYLVNSIAFYPALIAFGFLIVSFLLILFDFSELGREVKSNLPWLGLKDAETARNIIAVVAGGILSLTVFSFSMVMIVLNQAASQMSNRILNKLIGNRFQQVILGFYIGTIVFSLFLLSTVRDSDVGIYIPAISTYILIILAITDIFLFIYFLHYITQSVKYEVIIHRILDVTKKTMKNNCTDDTTLKVYDTKNFQYEIKTPRAGVFEGIDKESLLNLAVKNDLYIEVIHKAGTYLLKGMPVLTVQSKPYDEIYDKLQHSLFLNTDETIANNYLYGFRQLSEIAIKALSPGINDPGTATLALRALFNLFHYRISCHPENSIKDESGTGRIFINNFDFDTIFENTILPVWDYGKKDRIIINELISLIQHFTTGNTSTVMLNFLKIVEKEKDNLYHINKS